MDFKINFLMQRKLLMTLLSTVVFSGIIQNHSLDYYLSCNMYMCMLHFEIKHILLTIIQSTQANYLYTSRRDLCKYKENHWPQASK